MQSVVVLVLSAMVLDQGESLSASIYGLAAFWSGVILIILRRPTAPTSLDLRVIRFGPVIVVIVAQILARWIWHLRGV